jgi:hypothetical protein
MTRHVSLDIRMRCKAEGFPSREVMIPMGAVRDFNIENLKRPRSSQLRKMEQYARKSYRTAQGVRISGRIDVTPVEE